MIPKSLAWWLPMCYLAGSLPTGYLMARAFLGIDIRQHGSGNPGATNVYRVVGKAAGLATFAIDFLKGLLPTWLALKGFEGDWRWAAAAGLACIAGHNWTCFLNFKGGKGVATSAGVFMALAPTPTAFGLAVFGVTLAVTRHVSLGSIAGALSVPIVLWLMRYTPAFIYLALACALLIVALHHKNILRLWRGEEIKPAGGRT